MGLRDLIFSIKANNMTGTAFDAVRKGLDGLDGAARKASDRLESIGHRLTTAGGLASIGGSLPLAAGLRGALQTSADFEASMNRVGSVLKPTTAEMEALSTAARELGRSTTFSALDAADAVEVLARNGLSAADILDGALSASLALAGSSGSDMASAGDLVTDILTQFQMEARDAAAAADLFAGGMVASKFGFDDFRLAIGQAGGAAAGAGVEFEDLVAALAATSGQFASGSDAGTSFKTFIASLPGKSSDARGAIQSLGLEFYTASGALRDMTDIADELDRVFTNMSEKDRSSAMQTIFGTDAIRTALGLMQAGRDGIEGLNAALADTSAAELAEARMQGAKGAAERFSGAIDDLNLAIGSSGLLDAFTGIVSGLASLVSGLSGVDPHILSFGTALAAIGVALPPLLFSLGAIATAVAAIGGPVTLAIAGFAALGAAAFAFREELGAAIGWITKTYGEMSLLEKAIGLPALALRGLGDLFAAVFPEAAATVGRMVDAVTEYLMGRLRVAFEWVKGAVGEVGQAFYQLWDDVVGHSYVPDMVDAIGKHFSRLTGNMVKPAAAATDTASASFERMGQTLAGQIASADSLGEAFEGMRDRIVRAVLEAALSPAFEQLAGAAGRALSGLSAGGAGGGLLASLGSLVGRAAGIPAFANGGAFEVGGLAGRDRNLVPMRLTRGERVEITPRGRAGSAPVVNVTIQTPSPAAFAASRAQIGTQVARAVAAGQRGA